MGHTEAVAMAHYRQVLDSDFEKLSALKTDTSFATNSATEHAVLGLNRLEMKKSGFGGIYFVPPMYFRRSLCSNIR